MPIAQRSIRCLAALWLACCLIPAGAHAQPTRVRMLAPTQHYALSAPAARYLLQPAGVDRARELAADRSAPKWRPLRYAVGREIHNAAFSRNAQSAGEWLNLPGGMALWRLPVHADGALTLDFGFRKLFLPPGAQLFISNTGHQLGPYDETDNRSDGQFWTPLLYGSDALIEVLLPAAVKDHLQIDLGTVHAGFRDVFATAAHAKSFSRADEGSGSCNDDTICPEGDAWRSEINAEAILLFNHLLHGYFCSGQLMNDARGDHLPYLSTANHCIAMQDEASSLTVYWKYESPVCRAPFSAASAQPVPTDNAIAQAGGADLKATYQPADFTLLLLRTTPPANAHVYFNGWDRSEDPFDGAVVLHHPQADAKRISFAAGSVTVDDRSSNATSAPGINHWRVDHYSLGTTEEGSSGSGLLDGRHRLRGVLSGGAALCTELDGDDYYGRLSTAWEGDGTPDSRLRDWLDPLNSGALTVDGSSAEPAPVVDLALSASTPLINEQITLSASVSGGTPPYTYAFDLDGDGIADNLDANASSMIASYPNTYAGNVRVTVTDRAGHAGAASRAVVVQAPSLKYISSGGFGDPNAADPVAEVCGNNDSVADPGERFDAAVHLQNFGTAASSGGYAVFAQDTSVANPSRISLETPAVAVPTLAPGESTIVHMTFSIAPEAVCGASVVINYLGTADDNGFSSNPHQVAVLNSAPVAQCHPASCSTSPATIIPKRGNFFDPHRAGSGMTQLTATVPGIGPVFFGAWFTGDTARYPTWYIANDVVKTNQVNTTLFQTHLNAPNQFPEVGSAVGSAQISVVSETKFIYTWTLNGKAGGAIYVPLLNDSQNVLRSWFNTNESGWGTFDELFPSVGAEGHPFMFNLDFLYDNAGMPRWTTGSKGSYVDGDVLSEIVARPSCPSCVWVDYTIGAQAVGPLSYQFSGANPRITTNLLFPPAYPGTWIRTNLPLVPLVQ